MVQTILRKPALLRKVPFGNSTLYRLIDRGDFPKPIKLGGKDGAAVGWLENEVEDWQKRRIAERDGKHTAPKRRRRSAK
jgi:prophage regulatory protein